MQGSDDQIIETIGNLKKDVDNIEEQITMLSVYVEGGTGYYDFRNMSFVERKRFINTLNKKAEARSGKDYM